MVWKGWIGGVQREDVADTFPQGGNGGGLPIGGAVRGEVFSGWGANVRFSSACRKKIEKQSPPSPVTMKL